MRKKLKELFSYVNLNSFRKHFYSFKTLYDFKTILHDCLKTSCRNKIFSFWNIINFILE